VADDPKGEPPLNCGWISGRPSRRQDTASQGDGLTVGELANRFLTTKRVWSRAVSYRLARFTSTGQAAKSWRPCSGRIALCPIWQPMTSSNFARPSARVGAGCHRQRDHRSPHDVQVRLRSRFSRSPARYGQSFNKPSRKTLRQARVTKGPRMFEASELRAVIDAAKLPLRRSSCWGQLRFGASDVSSLPLSLLIFGVDGSLSPPKTGIHDGEAVAETVAAVREAIDARPIQRTNTTTDSRFLTRFGTRWVKSYVKTSRRGRLPMTPSARNSTAARQAEVEAEGPGILCSAAHIPHRGR